MYRNTKVATCSYCGTRAALVLDQGRHELVCQACGAPLHELKALPVKEGRTRESRPHAPARPPHRWSDSERARKPGHDRPKYDRKAHKKRKKRKSLTKKLFEEAVDLIEDIFD